jgi:hypothetical protein
MTTALSLFAAITIYLGVHLIHAMLKRIEDLEQREKETWFRIGRVELCNLEMPILLEDGAADGHETDTAPATKSLTMELVFAGKDNYEEIYKPTTRVKDGRLVFKMATKNENTETEEQA